jgi:septal ring factor EnvC (AmiA/AmiB activator)
MQMEAEIDSRAFQEIVDDFVEVHKAASQDVDIGLLLSEVKITIQSGEKKHQELLTSFSMSCTNAKEKLNSFIKRLEDQRDEAKNQLANTWAKQLSKGRAGIAEATSGRNKTQAALASVTKQMTDIVIRYHAGVSETDSKLFVVKQLRDIIEDELINPAALPGKSFIQITKFTEKLKDLQELVKKSGDTMYTPIIETLVQLASQQNFSDQKLLNTILKNLKALEDNLRKFKKEKEHDLDVTLKNLKAQEENLTAQLQDYHHLEQRYMSDVAEANTNTELLTGQLLIIAGEIARKQDEIRSLGHLCDTENDFFKTSTSRLAAIKKNVVDATNIVMALHK